MLKIRYIAVLICIFALIAFIVPTCASADTAGSSSGDHHTYIVTFKDNPNKLLTSDNQYSVSGFKNKIYQYSKQHDVNSIPGTIKYNYNIINAVAVELNDSQLSALEARSDVASVIPDSYAHADSEISDLSSDYIKLDRVASTDNVTPLWDQGYTGTGINVSIIDSGIDATSPDLVGKVTQWVDFVNHNNATSYDDFGHGTAMAGIIAGSGAESDGQNKGMAYNANLFSAKVLNVNGVASYSDMKRFAL